jgi:CheY-like chemotaxis protein
VERALGPILIIDDVEEHRDLLLQVLEDSGYDVASASDGEEALSLLSGMATPSLILLDYRMPGMDGAEFLRRLRSDADAERREAPVAIMTGLTHDVLERVGPFGVSAVLEKPFGLGALRRVVVRFCGPGVPRYSHEPHHPAA